MKKQPFDDETLMAFANGELDQATAAAVEDAMGRDDELMARVAIFMETRARADAEMAPSLDRPASAKQEWAVRELVEASRGGPTGNRGTTSTSKTFIETERRRRSPWQGWKWVLPLAALLVTAIAAAIVGYQFGKGGAREAAGTLDRNVVAALQTLASGESANFPGTTRGSASSRPSGIRTARSAVSTRSTALEPRHWWLSHAWRGMSGRRE